MRQNLHLITLGVENLQRAADFYEKVLGWQRSEASQDEILFFQLGGMVLSLYSREALAADALADSAGKGFAGFTVSFNARSEREVDDIINEVKTRGGTIAKPAQKVFWGGYSGYIQDPDGYLIEIAYNPFWKLDDHDQVKL